jgi:hypothetical protein
MAFTLRVTFSGLCLFVPEPAGGGGTGRMQVLMPKMVGHHCSTADRHVALAAYDAGYLLPEGPLLGVPALARLSGHTLAFGAGDAASLSMCSQIVNLQEITGRPVDPDTLGADTGNRLTSRVVLAAGGMTRVAPGVCWEMRPGEIRPLAHRVEWEIPDHPGEALTLVSTPLGGGGTPRMLGTLHPRNGLLNLEVFHETPQDLPPEPLPLDQQPEPAVDDTAPHFAAFYSLFGEDAPVVMPRYRGPLADWPQAAGGCPEIPPDMGGTAFNCLVAGAYGE